MTPLRRQMLDAMVARGLAERTQETDADALARMSRHFGRGPDCLEPSEIEGYMAYGVPAHVVASGMVMLARLSESHLDGWVAEHSFAAFTPQTITDPVVFRQQLRDAQRLDHWFAEGQFETGFAGISLPLVNRKGECCAALGMTVPASQYTPQQVSERLLPALRATAQALRPLL